MITPRDYQEEGIVGLFDFFQTHPEGNPLLAYPPGSGKTVVIAEFIRRALSLYPQTRILNLVHVKELIVQAHQKLLELWPSAPAGIYSSGLNRRDLHLPIIFAGIGSIVNQITKLGHFDLVLIDECDMISHNEQTQYRKLFKALIEVNPAIRFIGLTGTPWRTGVGCLTQGGVFTDLIVDYCTFEKFNSLVDRGYLCPLIPKQTKTEIDVTDVHVRGGEFVESEVQKTADKESITRAAIAESVRTAHDRNHWLIFTTGISHANNVCDMLKEFGVSAACVHTNLEGGDKERDSTIADFKAGRIRAMVGVGVFGVGFDCPQVDCIVMLRPTMSARIHVQYLGRGLRIHSSKTNTLVLDFAGNTKRLGCVNDVVTPRKKGKGRNGSAPFKVCPVCSTYAHTRAKICVSCLHEFPEVFNGKAEASELELIRREPKVKKEKPPSVIVIHDVSRVDFNLHKSRDPYKPWSLKATYYCGLQIFSEYMCFEHPAPYARHRAHEAWRKLSGGTTVPVNSEEAIGRVKELRSPVQVKVEHEGKYPSIKEYSFVGFSDNNSLTPKTINANLIAQ